MTDTTWDDVAAAFAERGGSDEKIRKAIAALQTTKLKPAFVLSTIDERFPL